MAGGAWRRSAARARTLRNLLRDTTRALQEIQDVLTVDPEVERTIQDITSQSSRPTALVVMGCSPSARARLLNCLLGRRLLPENLPRGSKWLHIQYGATTQAHLTVGNSEFELVEVLECNQGPWDTLPVQDIARQDHTDLGTMLEVEINNSFLKDGLKIIVPPDVMDPGMADYATLKHLNADLYQRRETILKSYSPVYLYALDKFGTNIFNDNICNKMDSSRNEDDFWSTFNLYYMLNNEKVEKKVEMSEDLWKEAADSVFSAENCLDLHQIKDIDSSSQVFFVLFSDSRAEEKLRDPQSDATESTESVYNSEELPESDQLMKVVGRECSIRRLHEEHAAFMNDLLDQWELITSPPKKHHVKSQWTILNDKELFRTVDKEDNKRKKDDNDVTVKNRSSLLNLILKFATETSQTYLLDQCTRLSELHVKLLQQFILASFDLARELQVVPRKIQYVAQQEQQLYETINDKFSQGDKKRELVQMMQEVLDEIQTDINDMDWSVDDLPCHQDKRFTLSSSIFHSTRSKSLSIRLTEVAKPSDLMVPDVPEVSSDVEEAVSYDSYNFDDFEIIHSNEENPSSEWSRMSPSSCTSSCARVSTKQAALDVQHTVLSRLSQKISLKLVKFVDCLKVSYFGTLQRCLESLEGSCRSELGGRPASEAMLQLLSVARDVDLGPCASVSALRDLLDSLRRLFSSLRLSAAPEAECCALSAAWRRRAASRAARRLDTHTLARIISEQILERLSVAHERYQSALNSLETALASRLHHTEDVKLAIRKKFAPSFARLCLESTSMCDLLMYGMPELGREIGRGQYGVVYSVRGSWAGHSPAAVKSVLPADTRHYRELAMEFFYTRSIPAHPRIVRLLGSLVQRGTSPCVLLVSQRFTRDLHAAVRHGLPFDTRMRIACDIVEGIRYLHSLGLVHRDVKLKNVLLDSCCRAALSDLGFCTAGALLSGSVVGTPVHMAPELLAGNYHSGVDVYAFGVLFWYLCAGNIKLPSAFEAFQNKEQLWSKVKRGLRPERLPHFSDACWDLMQACWASEPEQRALLGDVQPQLERILEEARERGEGEERDKDGGKRYDEEEDSLDMTGLEQYRY
nr:dual serine/threonine and tyrosine protein kinase-like [Danaus plexippus plexippus]